MADQNISTIVRFDNRELATLTESNIRIMFDDHPFDMNLIAANDKKVPVHYFVMMMFSPYIRLTLKDELPAQPVTDGKLNCSHFSLMSSSKFSQDFFFYLCYSEYKVNV